MPNHIRSNRDLPQLILASSKSRLILATLLSFIAGAFLMFVATRNTQVLPFPANPVSATLPTSIQLEAILHYATSEIIPQQSLQEIMQSFNVLRTRAPCNFLVFGLGYDSLMWASLNPNGTTLFLEESTEWVDIVLKDAPFLRAETVSYRTHFEDANQLLVSYRENPKCHPKATLKGNRDCPLALDTLPDEVYDTEWDVIMIDAPRGWERGQPGRMAPLYSMAVMARARKGAGNTHVYIHDINRDIEKTFAKEFLCEKYKVGGVGRLWHFEIPPTRDTDDSHTFC